MRVHIAKDESVVTPEYRFPLFFDATNFMVTICKMRSHHGSSVTRASILTYTGSSLSLSHHSLSLSGGLHARTCTLVCGVFQRLSSTATRNGSADASRQSSSVRIGNLVGAS